MVALLQDEKVEESEKDNWKPGLESDLDLSKGIRNSAHKCQLRGEFYHASIISAS
jgi:hypothetical protein